jgi:hypothetical protein
MKVYICKWVSGDELARIRTGAAEVFERLMASPKGRLCLWTLVGPKGPTFGHAQGKHYGWHQKWGNPLSEQLSKLHSVWHLA